MKFTDIPPQSWFFYDLKWTVEMDTLLLRRIIAKEQEWYPTPPAKSPHALLTGMGSINQEFGTHLRFVDVEERVAFLKGCYTTFKKITRLPKTHWDLHKNCITADDGDWQRIFMDDVFTQAYYYTWEPEYYKMCVLFEANGIKTEPARTVILISDSPHGKEQVLHNTSDSSAEDEVTSPMARAPTRLARRLFDGDAHSSIVPPNRNT